MHAAALTSLSYLPQIQKAMPRDSTSDLSLKKLVALSAAGQKEGLAHQAESICN
jgi:uncharacterized protein with PQ loop repeat